MSEGRTGGRRQGKIVGQKDRGMEELGDKGTEG